MDKEESVEDTLSSLAETFELCYDDVLKLYERYGEDNLEALVKAVAELACY